MAYTPRDNFVIKFDPTSTLIPIMLYLRKYNICSEFDIYLSNHTNKSYIRQYCILQVDETETEKIKCIGGSKPKRSKNVHFSLLQSFMYDNRL
jgi:hypothetical protein